MFALPPLILGKSRVRKRARTDLCGGRSAMVVPTATTILGRPVSKAFRFDTRHQDCRSANVVSCGGKPRKYLLRLEDGSSGRSSARYCQGATLRWRTPQKTLKAAMFAWKLEASSLWARAATLF